MQLTIELAPVDPNYDAWRRLIRHTANSWPGGVSYLQAAEALGREHGFSVEINDHKNGYLTIVTLNFEQDRLYTMFMLRCL